MPLIDASSALCAGVKRELDRRRRRLSGRLRIEGYSILI
jgi:hypothetical protein